MAQAIGIKVLNYSRSSLPVKTAQNVLDFLVLCGAFSVAYLLRFDFSLPAEESARLFVQLLPVAALQLLILRWCGVHKFIWRYVSVHEINQTLASLVLSVVPLFMLRIAQLDSQSIASVPLSIIILDYFLAAFGILGIRVLRREIYELKERAPNASTPSEKPAILLIGAGRAGVMTLAEIKNRPDLNFEIKGFIDDDPLKFGSVINGVEVIGATENLPFLIKKLKINQVIITIAQATRQDFRRIHDICKTAPVKVKTIPGLYELLQEKVSVSRIRDVEIEDLLGRMPVELNRDSIYDFLAEKTILVTGAGGSIGSELARQLLMCKIKKLILVERSEFALFNIERELAERDSSVEIVPVIGDICDTTRMQWVFKRFRPQVVFHAAAHKHVPMMERNSAEALKNNVLGTNAVGRIAGENGVEVFVLISTDKAVNPTSIMGASKRLAELVVQDLNRHFATRFVAVRFGNVIGSNGSVIPIFREQIRKGGPVTVTHPQMTRYFMTIPEASQLVLQAGALGRGGEIFILDMGEPVKILDLAQETIRLSGLKLGEDIQVVFTGVRPGEKLCEELESDAEQLIKTAHSKIFIGQIASRSSVEIKKALEATEDLCRVENDSGIRFFLADFLPESNFENIPAQPSFAISTNGSKRLHQSSIAVFES